MKGISVDHIAFITVAYFHGIIKPGNSSTSAEVKIIVDYLVEMTKVESRLVCGVTEEHPLVRRIVDFISLDNIKFGRPGAATIDNCTKATGSCCVRVYFPFRKSIVGRTLDTEAFVVRSACNINTFDDIPVT